MEIFLTFQIRTKKFLKISNFFVYKKLLLDKRVLII